MSAAAIFHAHNLAEHSPYNSMKGGVVASLIFHGVILLLTVVGAPFVVKDTLDLVNKPIPVEIVTIDEKTQAPEKPKPKKAEPAESKPKPASKMTSDAPPILAPDRPPEPDVKAEPKEAVPPPVVPKSKPKPPPPKKKTPEPKPSPAPVPKENQDELFSSLLKNIAPDAQEAPVETPEPEGEADKANNVPLGEQLTMSELDAFKQQLTPCWNVQSGAKYAENLVVQIRVFMNRDQTVQSASLVDQIRYGLDSHYRAAADAALRALRNPACQPFNLPEDKYERWKVIVINFDPREML